MRTPSICFATMLVLISPFVSAQWVQTNGPLMETAVKCLAVSGPNVFAGFSRVWNGQTYISGNIFRSTDIGTSWTPALTSLQNTSVTSLAISGPNLFAGTGERDERGVGTSYGVFPSTDDGTVWTQVNSGLKDLCVMSLYFDGSDLYAGTCDYLPSYCDSGSVYLSTDQPPRFVPVGAGHGKSRYDSNFSFMTSTDERKC